MYRIRKRLSVLLAVLMCLTCLPVGVLADEETPAEIAEESIELPLLEIAASPADGAEETEEPAEEPAVEETETAADEPSETEMQPEVSAQVSTEESVVEAVDLSSPALDGASVVASGTCGVAISEETFPDAVFRAYVTANFDTDADGTLSEDEISAVTYISVSGDREEPDEYKVSSLKGIEHFTALTTLYCENCLLTELDVSANTALWVLDCSYNSLATLDVSANTALRILDCSENSLTKLVVSGAEALDHLNCYDNSLTALDVSANTALYQLYCYNNSLSTLDVSANTALVYLDCCGNCLTELDLSQNTALETLICNGNAISALDLSKNTSLTWLNCSDNSLATLDVSANTALTALQCAGNGLNTLGVSKNTALTELYCSDNSLGSLDLSANTALVYLDCCGNCLTELDLSQNTALETLICNGNAISALDLSKNTSLTSCLEGLLDQRLDVVVSRYEDGTYYLDLSGYLAGDELTAAGLDSAEVPVEYGTALYTYTYATGNETTGDMTVTVFVTGYPEEEGTEGPAEDEEPGLPPPEEGEGGAGESGEGTFTNDNGDSFTWTYSGGTLTITGAGALPDYEWWIETPWCDYHRSVQTVVLGEGITAIGTCNFATYAAMTGVTIPVSVTAIGTDAFMACHNLSEVIYTSTEEGWDKTAAWNAIAIESGNDKLWEAVGIMPAASGTFTDEDGNEMTWDLAEGVLTLSGSGAVSQCPWDSYSNFVRKVVVEEGVTTLGGSLFTSYQNLAEVVLPKSIAFIGEATFGYCTELEENGTVTYAGTAEDWAAITIGTNNRALWLASDYTFQTSGTLENSVGTLEWAIEGTVFTIKGDGEIPDFESEYSRPWADYWDMIDIVILSQQITAVGDYTFYGCEYVEELHLPTTLTTIGDYAFSSCNSLRSVTYSGEQADWYAIRIGTGNESLWEACPYAYYTEGELSDGVSWSILGDVLTISGEGAIPDYTYTYSEEANNGWGGYVCDAPWFGEYSRIDEIVIEDGITGIGDCAFVGLCFATELSVPDSVTAIGNGAFYDCHNLRVNYADTKEAWYAIEIEGNNTRLWEGIGYPVRSSGSLSDTVSWTLENGVLTISGTGAMPAGSRASMDYSPDAPWNGYHDAFSSVVIESGITSVGASAFAECSQLSDVSIGKDVTTIGSSAFESCWNLAKISLPANVTAIESGAFRYCDALITVEIEKGLTTVGGDAFYGCGIRFVLYTGTEEDWSAVTISDGNDSLTAASFTYGYTAGEKIKLAGETVTEEEGNEITWTLYSDGSLVIAGEGAAARSYWSGYSNAITSVTVEEGITSLPIRAFWQCRNMESVTLPDTLTAIPNYAFYWNEKLAAVELPDSVTSIGSYAFGYCRGLTEITIPENVTALGTSTFVFCDGLEKVTIEGNMTSIGTAAFDYCDSLKEINIPDTVTSIGAYAFRECSALQSINIPDGITTIEYAAFRGCESLAEVKIPEKVTTIGHYAFADCEALEIVEIPDGITTLEYGAFRGCESLVEVEIPAGITAIEYAVFAGCESLTGVTLPQQVESIGECAFAECGALTTVDMPKSVESFGYQAFVLCEKLTTVNYAGSPGRWDRIEDVGGNDCIQNAEILFAEEDIGGTCGDVSWLLLDGTIYITGDGEITWQGETEGAPEAQYPWYAYREDITAVVVDGTCTIDHFAFHKYPNLKTVAFSGGANVGAYAFARCPALESVTIGTGATSISVYAFLFCEALETLTIPDTLETIGDSAFEETALTSVTVLDADGEELSAEDAQTFWNTVLVEYGNDPLWDACGYSPSGSGTVNEDISWSFGDDGTGVLTLTITGAGDIPDYLEATIITEETPDGITEWELVEYLERPWERYAGMVERVVVEEGITGIGAYAFGAFHDLASVSLPDGLVSIGDQAFWNTLYVKSFELPVTVKSIGASAFAACWGLKTVTYAGTEEQWNAIAIESGNAALRIAAPYDVHVSGTTGEDLTWSLDGNTLTISGDGAMDAGYGYDSTPWGELGDSYNEIIKAIVVQDGVTTISARAFALCEALETLSIPSTVTDIGESAVENCGALATVYYNDTAAKWEAITIGEGNDALLNAELKALPDVTVGVVADDEAVAKTESILNDVTTNITVFETDENTGEATVVVHEGSDPTQTENKILVVTEEEQKLRDAVADESVTLSTEVVTTVLQADDLSETDAAAIAEMEANEKMESGESADENKVSGVAVYVDLKVNLVATNGDTNEAEVIGAVTETASDIQFTMDIAKAELDAMGRSIEDVYIVRVHNKTAEKIWSYVAEDVGYTYNEETGVYTLQFATSQFSSYMLMYQRVLGDITGNNDVDVYDVLRLVKNILGVNVTVVKDSTDVNGDGFVNILDVVRLLRYVSGRNVRIH